MVPRYKLLLDRLAKEVNRNARACDQPQEPSQEPQRHLKEQQQQQACSGGGSSSGGSSADMELGPPGSSRRSWCSPGELLDVARAEEAVAAVAMKLNESLKLKAATTRVAEVQALMVHPDKQYPLVKAGRWVLKEGALQKVSAATAAAAAAAATTMKTAAPNSTPAPSLLSKKNHYFFLFSDALLLICQEMTKGRGKPSLFQLKRTVMVYGCREIQGTNQFIVSTDQKEVHLAAPNATAKHAWIKAFLEVTNHSVNVKVDTKKMTTKQNTAN